MLSIVSIASIKFSSSNIKVLHDFDFHCEQENLLEGGIHATIYTVLAEGTFGLQT